MENRHKYQILIVIFSSAALVLLLLLWASVLNQQVEGTVASIDYADKAVGNQPAFRHVEWISIYEATSSKFILDDDSIYFSNGFERYKLQNAEVSSFLVGYIGAGIDRTPTFYAKDNKSVYRAYEIIEKADVHSFTILSDKMTGVSKDRHHVFSGNYMIQELSPESVVLVDNFFLKDHDTVYYAHPIDPVGVIASADPTTFEVLPRDCANSCDPDSPPLWLRDKTHIFFANEVVIDADPETFEVLSDRLGKDQNNVYCMAKKVMGADPQTFTASTTNVWEGRDANARYRCDSLADHI